MANVPQSFANNANTTLANAALAGDSSIVVASATGFPSTTPYTILVETELMLVTSGATTTTWGVSRGQEGTAAAGHAATVSVSQEFTVAGLQSLNQGYWPYLSPGGNTGATQQTRYMGATTSGAPGSGAYQVGDFVIDQTGNIYICRIAGSPGTWKSPYPAWGAATVAASETTASISYVALTTPGPAATVTTLTTAWVDLSANMSNSAVGYCFMGFAVSGATTLAANDVRSIAFLSGTGGFGGQLGGGLYVTGLTAGSNTFTAQYHVNAGTGTFSNRNLRVQAGPT
jgi:hypothetical protein